MIPGSNKMTTPDIPLDIIEKILLKLPTKSIIRFRIVCKSWRDLSKTPRFVALHHTGTDYKCVVHISVNRRCRGKEVPYPERDLTCEKCSSELVFTLNGGVLSSEELLHPENPHITFNRYLGSPDTYPRWFEEETPIGTVSWPHFRLAGNCNGILCITDYADFCLVNPSTGEMKEIPSAPVKLGEGYCELVGLGFDHLTSEFKIVIIVNRLKCSMSGQQTALVYNLKTNSWTALGETPVRVFGKESSALFFNGFIHWCVCTTDPRCRILTFNTTSHLFQQMNLPGNYILQTESNLFVLNENLLAFVSMASARSFLRNTPVNIWVMTEYGVEESWTKLYSITTPSSIRQPVSLWEENKLLVRTMDGSLVLYDLLQGRELGSIDLSGSHDLSIGYGVCKESLISLSSV